MSTLLVANADAVITMDDRKRKIIGGGLFVRDNVIEKVGKTADLPKEADEIIDAKGLILVPGLVNTHHHFFQTLTRVVPGAQEQKLFDWLVRLFPIWSEIHDEAIYVSSLTAMAEMILSGCTTSSDHLYIYPNDSTLDAQVRAAKEIGMRFHVTRGSMSLGRSQGGLPPDYLVQKEDKILQDCQRVIDTYHDSSEYSMLRVVLGPCAPFTVTPELMKESAKLARAADNVMLHTHVAETRDEETYCLQKYNIRPVEYIVEQGWVGPDVWWAHGIFLNDDEIHLLAETGTGVAHCPSSNMRLGSGICRVREMLDAGVKVGIGVDGAASNDTSHVLLEARNAVLLQRVKGGASAMSVEEGIQLATLGSASVLGRSDIGSLASGKAADFIGINAKTLNLAGGAVHDPLAALLFCLVDRVDLSVINGRIVVKGGELQTIDVEKLIERHNQIALEIVSKHPEPERFQLV
jgi:cytosine/adenosine deaminase-related metal-dependent hydrolase